MEPKFSSTSENSNISASDTRKIIFQTPKLIRNMVCAFTFVAFTIYLFIYYFMERNIRLELKYDKDTPSKVHSPSLGRFNHSGTESEGGMKRSKSGDLREREKEALDFEGEVIDTAKKHKRWRKKSRRRRKAEESKDEEELVQEEVPEETLRCLLARTALIAPFTYPEDSTKRLTAFHWFNELLGREFIDHEGMRRKCWKAGEVLPPEVADLNRQFRQVFGWRSDKRSTQTWMCWKLEATEHFNVIFQNGIIGAFENGEQVELKFSVERIQVLFYPLGAGLLVLHLNWVPSSLSKEISIQEIRTRVYVSKYKQPIHGLISGWRFPQARRSNTLLPSHAESLSKDIFSCFYGDTYLPLQSLISWILCLPPFESPFTLEPLRHVFHHTTVVVEKEPSSSLLHEYIFCLKRAFGQKNRPPPNVEESLGAVLVWRLNRYIGIAREGTVSISWPISPQFQVHGVPVEAQRWERKFQGVFLLLTLHSHAEKLVLGRLSDLAATYAENLNEENSLPSSPAGAGNNQVVEHVTHWEAMKFARNNLRILASLLARYMLSMSSDDCGGVSEYSEFFTTLRLVFGIPELREELSTELHDVLAVVDSNYFEEERRQRSQIQLMRNVHYRRQKIRDRSKERRNRNMEMILLVLTSLVVPFTVVSGIFGMNIHSLPLDVPFWALMVATFGVSVLIFFAILLVRWIANRKEEPSELDEWERI